MDSDQSGLIAVIFDLLGCTSWLPASMKVVTAPTLIAWLRPGMRSSHGTSTFRFMIFPGIEKRPAGALNGVRWMGQTQLATNSTLTSPLHRPSGRASSRESSAATGCCVFDVEGERALCRGALRVVLNPLAMGRGYP